MSSAVITPCSHGLAQIASLGEGAVAGIDEQRRPAHGRVVDLAHVGPEAADEVDMCAGLQPGSLDDRGRCRGGAGDDVGATHRARQIIGHRDREVVGLEAPGKVAGLGRRAPPDQYPR